MTIKGYYKFDLNLSSVHLHNVICNVFALYLHQNIKLIAPFYIFREVPVFSKLVTNNNLYDNVICMAP